MIVEGNYILIILLIKMIWGRVILILMINRRVERAKENKYIRESSKRRQVYTEN